MRVGIGYDSHRLVEGRKLILGGIEIPFHKGLMGHSDADILCHAIIDAIIGALGEGDIGKHFPDRDNAFKNASSINLLQQTVQSVSGKGFRISYIDSTVVTEAPKLAPFIDKMKEALSTTGIPAHAINIKAKTSEGLGFIGRGEGMMAQAVCLLQPL